MIVIAKIKNPLLIFIGILIIIILIGIADYYTGPELSFSFFYLLPISFLALYRGTQYFSILICGISGSILWFLAEFLTREYSTLIILFWNTFVRLSIFLAFGILLLYLKEKQKTLNQINTRLLELNEEKNKLIGIAAHDLRSPVGGIFSILEILTEERKGELSTKALELVFLAKNMANHTLVVLRNLLDVSKIESGKIELDLKTSDYISFIKEQISYSQIIADKKRIYITFSSEIKELMLAFDKHYLSEVIDNLLTNAIKYSFPEKQIIITVFLEDNKQLITEVIDFGKGIEEKEQVKLFQYFQTTSTRPTNSESSTGLGLAIAKKIVSLHGGEIGVKSKINQGSTFYIKLPIFKK